MIKKILFYLTGCNKIEKFRLYLMHSVNLDMIEFMKDKSLKGLRNNKEWNELINYYVEWLLPKFTYKEWLKILSIDNFYKKMSQNKNTDVRLNLEEFLKCHYLELYKMFNMKTYAKYQTRKKEDLRRLILINGAINPVNKNKVDAVFMIYKDESRMCYDVKSKKRIMLETLSMANDTLIITLVDSVKKTRLLNLFFEEK